MTSGDPVGRVSNESRVCVMSVGKVFGPLHFTRHDLAVLTIMRGRDHGVLDYNSARVAYGLPAVADWADINPWLNAVDPRVRSQTIFYQRYWIVYDKTRSLNTAGATLRRGLSNLCFLPARR